MVGQYIVLEDNQMETMRRRPRESQCAPQIQYPEEHALIIISEPRPLASGFTHNCDPDLALLSAIDQPNQQYLYVFVRCLNI